MNLRWRHAFLTAALSNAVALACGSFSGSDSTAGDDAAPGRDSATAQDGPDTGRDAGSGVDGGDAGGSADSAVSASRKRVFVTSAVPRGTFGQIQKGRVAADSFCAKAATQIKNVGVFKAWMSDGLTKATPEAPGPYYDVTANVLVFAEGGAFSSAGLTNEFNGSPPSEWWTGMASTTSIGDTCNQWKGDASYGSAGTSTSWFGEDGSAQTPCAGFGGILCFEE